ncbi:MAG TPA: hypothetical protein VNT01_10185 [Symbiobacteriaceae bacterium]|nr:hypothetical protein [Symbiobacteriaceae bacterium]
MPYPRKVPRPEPDGCISTDKAMRLLDMSAATFYRYKREFGDFPEALMEGGRAWYRVADLEAWKAKHMPQPE